MSSKEKMKGAVASSFMLNLTIMRYLGLYPVEKHPRYYKFYSYAIYTVLLAPVFLLGLIQLFFKQRTDGMFDAATIGVVFLSPKLFAVLLNGENIRRCIGYLDNEIFLRHSQCHMHIIHTCMRICRRNSSVFIFGCVTALTGWSGKLLFGDHNQLPLDVWLPFADMPKLFYCLYFDLVIGAFYATLACGTIDPLIAGIMCHASGQLQVLKENLKHLDKDLIQIEVEESIKSRLIYERVTQCIDHYDAIASLVEECEQCFSAVIFCQFMESVVVICMCCLQISKLQKVDINLLILGNFLVVVLIQLYFFCYYGTILIEENGSLADAIYMSVWYEYNQQSKKALLILMERSKKSLTVTAGKILDLSLETFTLILRRSYSLLAVLKNY